MKHGMIAMCMALVAAITASTTDAGTVGVYDYDGTSVYDTVTVNADSSAYQIDFYGTSNSGLTWHYKVSEIQGQSLSHFVFDVCAVPTGHSGPGVYTDEHVLGGVDPTTGINGIKWDDLPDNYDNTGGEEDDMAFFTFSYDVAYGVADMQVAVKTGGRVGQTGVDSILGPNCEPCTVVPTPAAAGLGILGLAGLALRRRRRA